MTVILVFLNARIDHLKATTPIHICIGSTCHDLGATLTTSVHHTLNTFSIKCHFENDTLPKGLERLNKLLDSLEVLEERRSIIRFIPLALKVRLAKRGLAKFASELDVFNSLPKLKREKLITKVLVNNGGALRAFEENLDVIKELDAFNIDPNEVLKMAKSCKT